VSHVAPQIEINGQKVLSSGTVVSYGNQSIDIHPLPTPYQDYTVRVTFQQKVGEGATIGFSPASASLFSINLINFDSPTLSGSSAPIHILHGLTNAVAHEPSGLIGHAKHTMDLMGANALLA
jgi:hypothetical protein